jgi:hypothetical protein
MKLTNYPLTILITFGLLAIGCESARRNELKAAKPVEAVQLDTTDMAFFQQQLSEAQVDSVWRSKGY